MNGTGLRNILIVGGGMDGWTAAAGLAHALRGQDVDITVLEDLADSVPESAEATLPVTHLFHQRLGIDERQLMQETEASFSLGTEFRDWNAPGRSCFQPAGPHGASIEYVHFHNYAVKARQQGDRTPFNDYSLCAVAARLGRFAHPVSDPGSILSTLSWSHHLDTGLYAAFMARHAAGNGARLEAGAVSGVEVDGDTGFIRALELEGGRRLEADLFIDCTGRKARLSRGALGAVFEDWGRWLPADRMLLTTRPAENPPPFSTVLGLEDCWIRSIASRQRATHRLVYHSGHLDEEGALERLAQAAGPAAAGEAEHSALASGRLANPWTGNCVALGAAAGFAEPLSDTRTALLQTGLMRLLGMLPDRSCSPLLAEEYNRVTALEYGNIRDFLVLHYHAGATRDTPFWRDCAAPGIPDTLAHKFRLFDEHGQVALYEEEPFPDTAWVSAWLGQGRWPAGYDPMLDNYDFPRLRARFDQMKEIIARAADAMPMHREYLDRYCG